MCVISRIAPAAQLVQTLDRVQVVHLRARWGPVGLVGDAPTEKEQNFAVDTDIKPFLIYLFIFTTVT